MDSSSSVDSDDGVNESPGRSYHDEPDFFDTGGNGADHFNDEATTTAGTPPQSPRYCTTAIVVLCAAMALMIVGRLASNIRDSNEDIPKESAMAFLELKGITSADTLDDIESPQSKALHWMVYEDPAKLEIHDPGFIQRYAVATMIFAVAVASPKIELLRRDMHFLSEYHECEWNARWIDEKATTVLDIGIRCNDAHQVNGIIMPGVGLKGRLPKELGSLDQMTKLVVDGNDLTGLIPCVPSLVTLSLAYNNIDGTLPEYIGLMTHLEEIVLAENLITGRLPEQIHNLEKLKRFSVSGNKISGGLPNLFHLGTLREIYGAFNSLEDRLEDDSFGELTNLRVLDLKNNRLQGSFPDALWTLSKLQVVDFHFNALDGHIPEIEGHQHPVLEYMDVSSNFLGGGLPTTLSNVTTLKHLDVSTNRFDKALVGDYGALTNLKTLLLTDNNLLGPAPIPDWLQRLSNLEHLSLQQTGRTGTIPDRLFDNLKHLTTLDMNWNRISGSIPQNVGRLTSLEHLLLNRNWLSGSVPTVLSLLPNLKTLMLDNNRLVGQIQACQISAIAADCGDYVDGCPDCVIEAIEVSCPCCTTCCYDENELCYTADWLSAILEMKRKDDPSTFYPSYYSSSDFASGVSFTPEGGS